MAEDQFDSELPTLFDLKVLTLEVERLTAELATCSEDRMVEIRERTKKIYKIADRYLADLGTHNDPLKWN